MLIIAKENAALVVDPDMDHATARYSAGLESQQWKVPVISVIRDGDPYIRAHIKRLATGGLQATIGASVPTALASSRVNVLLPTPLQIVYRVPMEIAHTVRHLLITTALAIVLIVGSNAYHQ